MRNNFERAAQFVLKQEVEPGHETDGSLHTDPNDPGGTTRFGISQRAYPHVDLTKLDWEGAKKIYLDIWIEAHCDDYEWPLDLVVFDTAFNMGWPRAKKILALTKEPYPYMFYRMLAYWYMKKIYFRTWIKRVLNVWQEIT